MPGCSYIAQKFHSSAQNALGLQQSRLKSILGRLVMNNASFPTGRVGAYGLSLITATDVKYGGISGPTTPS